jgi:GR25 family glycosyltransferase involved in LPS biosynthesis
MCLAIIRALVRAIASNVSDFARTFLIPAEGLSMYQGLFINLARNEARRMAMTRHLEQIGAASRYRRVEAVDGRAVAPHYPTTLDPGNLGLWLSHVQLLEAARESPEHLHIIEDDTILVSNPVERFDGFLRQADEQLMGWDLMFTDIVVWAQDVGLFRSLARMIQQFEQTGDVSIVDLKSLVFAATSSFFVNRQSINKLADLIATRWRLGVPIDIYLRDLVHQGALKAYLTVPFQTTVSQDSLQSDIASGDARSLAVITAYRRMFFQDANLPSLAAEMQQLIKGATHSARASVYLQTLFFNLSDQWVDL